MSLLDLYVVPVHSIQDQMVVDLQFIVGSKQSSVMDLSAVSVLPHHIMH